VTASRTTRLRVCARVAAVSEHSATIDGVDTFWRSAEPHAGPAPALFVHGVPTNSDIWIPFLPAAGGVALDLPGFGRSGKPADFDYSINGYDHVLGAFIDHLRLDRFSLVTHDWGGAALKTAQRLHDRLERLVIIATLPLFGHYRWHRVARIWRTPLAGELAMGFTIRPVLRRVLRASAARPDAIPDEFVDSIYDHFDHGTQRAILKLYRSAPPEVLGAAGSGLGAVEAPALVMFASDDPFIPQEFGAAYAQALGGQTRLEPLDRAGHWAWLDRPDLIDEVAEFLAA
jgi:pimeloyl-ACP methyl ester carboxylesterase